MELSHHFRLFSKPFLFLQMSHVSYRCPPCSQLLIFHVGHRMVEVGKTSGNNLLQAGSVIEGCSRHSPFRFEYVEGWRLKNLWATCFIAWVQWQWKMFGIFSFCLGFFPSILWVSRFSSFSIRAYCLFSIHWIPLWRSDCFPFSPSSDICIYCLNLPKSTLLCPFVQPVEIHQSYRRLLLPILSLEQICWGCVLSHHPGHWWMCLTHHQPSGVYIPLVAQPWEPRSSASVQSTSESTYLAHTSLIKLWVG